jgi:hypothetical protein
VLMEPGQEDLVNFLKENRVKAVWLLCRMMMLNASQRGMLYGLLSLMFIDFIKFSIETLLHIRCL